MPSSSLDPTDVSPSIDDDSTGSIAGGLTSAFAAFLLSRHKRNWTVAVPNTRKILLAGNKTHSHREMVLTEQYLKYD